MPLQPRMLLPRDKVLTPSWFWHYKASQVDYCVHPACPKLNSYSTSPVGEMEHLCSVIALASRTQTQVDGVNRFISWCPLSMTGLDATPRLQLKSERTINISLFIVTLPSNLANLYEQGLHPLHPTFYFYLEEALGRMLAAYLCNCGMLRQKVRVKHWLPKSDTPSSILRAHIKKMSQMWWHTSRIPALLQGDVKSTVNQQLAISSRNKRSCL